MQIVITGGAGFIGSHLCDLFVSRGHAVICVDNLLTGSLSNIAHLAGEENFTFVNQNVSKLIQIPGPVDFVLHFASPASPNDYLKYPIETLKVGALGTHNALGLALKKKAKFLLASTSEVYGDPLVHPQPESYAGNVDCVCVRGVYDEAKRFAEAMTLAYHRTHSLDTRIIRIFNTFGPRMRPNDGRVIPNFISQVLKSQPMTIYGDGTQTRSLTYITDMVNGIDLLMQSDEHLPVNIGNPEELTVLEIAKKIQKLSGLETPMVFRPLPVNDPKIRQPDISRAKSILGWSPKVSVDTGLKETIKFFAGGYFAGKI